MELIAERMKSIENTFEADTPRARGASRKALTTGRIPSGLVIAFLAYAIPRTSVLGAILLTGYLGGAIASHVRVGAPLFTHILFPIYVAVLLWGGLYLRDDRLRAMIPLRRARD